jgi:NADH:ubiquinone oxidoreductase subunit 6 (subunit J)
MSSISSGNAEFNGMMGKILMIVQVVCYGAAVIILMIAGLRYMNAAPEGKAQIKQQSIRLAIGALIMFAAGAIVSIISGFAGEIG